MKRSLFAVPLLALSSAFLLLGCAPSSDPQAPRTADTTIVFDEAEHDFGLIKQSGGIVSHDFSFTYRGDQPITITGTPGSCACTTAEVDKTELKPGEGGTLTVFFNPNLHAEPEGRFSKSVVLLTEPAIEPPPEVTVWQEIDLDLGEEAFELSGGTEPHEKQDEHDEVDQEDSHSPDDHEVIDDIGHSGVVPALVERQEKHFTLTAQEVNAELDDGLQYLYWTFDGQVPGPFLRARVGDRITITLRNPATNHMPHSIDLHAVNGPGGGATDVYPGQEKSFTFTALNPGIYVYHCATPEVAEHMANGAYGLILIEPENGLPQVDQEYYVMQGEFYPVLDRGDRGSTQLSGQKLLAENPDYIVFNGRKNALTGDRALQASVGETVRIYIGNGGVAKVSSFHVIGEIFDRVYPEGGTPIQENIQSTVIPAGGASIVEMHLDVPGTYKLVDHALARLQKGAYGEIQVSGEDQPQIFHVQ